MTWLTVLPVPLAGTVPAQELRSRMACVRQAGTALEARSSPSHWDTTVHRVSTENRTQCCIVKPLMLCDCGAVSTVPGPTNLFMVEVLRWHFGITEQNVLILSPGMSCGPET